ncbi:hypothetical protein [Phenylobacterium sp.]|uniref:hypothetical protein n=1 Tax=Phenylobacterium sp. TaxID=1871053 RepID=UPI002C780A64|nr:hypothetical protein [Phenylobacterium sp.]HLZ76310.1 hypothetical protein [Phenylobacterium sp.]
MAKSPPRPRATRAQRGSIAPLDPNNTFEKVVPPEYEMMIGRAMHTWSSLEQAIEEAVWALLSLDIANGRIVTGRLDANHKISLLRRLCEKRLPLKELQNVLTLIGRLEDLYSTRNLFAHAIWGTNRPSGQVVALSLKEKVPNDSSEDVVVAAYYEISQLGEIVLSMMKATNALVSFRKMVSPR